MMNSVNRGAAPFTGTRQVLPLKPVMDCVKRAFRHYAAPLLIIGSAVFVSACSSPQVIRSDQAVSYQGLQKIGEHGMGLPPRTVDQGRYTQVLINPVQISRAVELDTSPDVVKEVSAVFQQRLEAELSRNFTLTSSVSDAQTLVIKVRIMRIAEASPVVNAMTTLLIGPVQNGGLSVEVEALDGRSNQQVALLLLAEDAGLSDILDSYQRSSHAKALAQLFAGEVATFVSPLGRAAR